MAPSANISTAGGDAQSLKHGAVLRTALVITTHWDSAREGTWLLVFFLTPTARASLGGWVEPWAAARGSFAPRTEEVYLLAPRLSTRLSNAPQSATVRWLKGNACDKGHTCYNR